MMEHPLCFIALLEKIDKVFTSNKGIVEISFRILDVSTRQIKLSDMYLSDAGASSSNPDTEMIQKASNSIGEYILSVSYTHLTLPTIYSV